MTHASDADRGHLPAERPDARPYRCRRCGQTGHNQSTCRATDAEAAAYASEVRPASQRQHTCSHCGRLGHNRLTCGHPAKPAVSLQERAEIAQGRFEARHPGLLAQLGQVSDGTLAKAYGLSRQRVCQLRLREARRRSEAGDAANGGPTE